LANTFDARKMKTKKKFDILDLNMKILFNAPD